MKQKLDSISIKEIDIPLKDVSEEQRISGGPRTGSVQLAKFEGGTIGVWEMTPGVMRDVEVEEIFTVLVGDGTVEFEDGRSLSLVQGDIVRLRAGQRTIWTVTKALRKLYFSFSTPATASSTSALPLFSSLLQ